MSKDALKAYAKGLMKYSIGTLAAAEAFQNYQKSPYYYKIKKCEGTKEAKIKKKLGLEKKIVQAKKKKKICENKVKQAKAKLDSATKKLEKFLVKTGCPKANLFTDRLVSHMRKSIITKDANGKSILNNCRTTAAGL